MLLSWNMTLIWTRYEEPLLYGSFPEGFLWGTATAAYQVCQGEEEDIYSFSLSLHFDQISNFCFHHNLKEGGANKEIIIWATFTFGHFHFRPLLLLQQQVEGGANEGGKGKSIWDTFTSQPGNIDDGSSGEVFLWNDLDNFAFVPISKRLPVTATTNMARTWLWWRGWGSILTGGFVSPSFQPI